MQPLDDPRIIVCTGNCRRHLSKMRMDEWMDGWVGKRMGLWVGGN